MVNLLGRGRGLHLARFYERLMPQSVAFVEGKLEQLSTQVLKRHPQTPARNSEGGVPRTQRLRIGRYETAELRDLKKRLSAFFCVIGT